ncbi:amino acid adenylation protein [Amycolatopsis keratiniphila subsp. keratiniphila]|uniref:Amino acid adenylation protein n=2 Tax=Amycolatopsis keratiniphila TaxID=129921 RepID=A0A1W2LYW4_9PSEU|nr:amino acid adenylation protein [Amycolatopsis keratiniphila subsp. keratiniphila]
MAMPPIDNLAPPHRVRSGACLTDLLGHWAQTRPEAVAVVDGEREMTFHELEETSVGLAAYLTGLGIGVDDTVGLHVEPSADLMTGAWGILASGAAYLPLSPEYPEDRLRYMLEDSGTGVVVTQPHLAGRLAGLVPAGTRIVSVTDSGTAGVPRGPRPDSLAYVIYTSGSTGKPKGVMIEHHSVVSQLRWLQACGHLGRDITVLQKTPMSFDAAQWEILAPAAGARVVMSAPGSFRDPEALIDTVVKHGVTTLQCVPTLLQALLDTERFATCTTLRKLFSGGEALSRRLAKDLAGELPSARLINLYGPTECTINATAHVVDPDTIGESAGTVPIGVPADNTECFVLDAAMSPVDIGETGELYIGGVQLARGYLNRPEQTAEKFVPNPFVPTGRLYRTGDLVQWNPDGTLQFVGRADNQVKLRGYRVELDEIAVAIEEHTWVRRAAAVVTDDARTGSKALVACVELNPREAAVMDQGNHGGHHQSKASKLQVKAQLSNPGVRDLADRPAIALPGKRETDRQRREVFARKTYRYYEGGEVTRDDLAALLAPEPVRTRSREPGELTFAELGELLRWFGRFRSDERLLPKYAYASPGALYATQLYLETSGLDGLGAGLYYYHPVDHTLVRIGASTGAGHSVHFIGRTGAIEPVYKNNIREVLEFETGHMVAVFEEILPGYGLTISPAASDPAVAARAGAAAEDHYLGTFSLHADDGAPRRDDVELFVQAHPGRVRGLPAGTYRWRGGDFERISGKLIEAKHVIAINQQVYARAAFGITAVSRTADERLAYIVLGAKLHRLQRNGSGFGFMSSGYSSKSGHPLPAARRIDDILAGQGIAPGPSYFFVGGKVSPEQVRSEGMREDAVHMKGPAEIIRDELATTLPDYMIPNRVLVLDALPLTANGKVDAHALAETDAVRSASTGAPYVAPSTSHERWLAGVWGKALNYDDVSAHDDFFAAGGNSLTAVSLVNRINREYGTRLPLQVVFECPKLADLAARIGEDSAGPSSRLVPLATGEGRPVFCWPGLGGYPMNLRSLASESGLGRPFYGVQAHGINAGETPYATVEEMAKADVAEIRRVQPEGPYTLWGYSFGARVAFETAWQLEQQGQRVTDLLLICPGNPEVGGERVASYANPAYLTILLSVFLGSISGPETVACRETVRDEDGFVAFVAKLLPALGEQLIRRIVRIVEETYEFDYTFRELARRRIVARVTLFKADGDDYSFVENSSGYSATPPEVVTLEGDHYSVLKENGVAELVTAIRARLS